MGLPRFAVVDVETSGLSSRRHRILQIGVVTVEGDGTVVDQWSSLVRLAWPWSRVGPRRVHGITRRALRGAPTAGEAMAELRRRLDGAVFTAHNADFDAAFIERAAARSGMTLQLDRRLCTLAAVPPARSRPPAHPRPRRRLRPLRRQPSNATTTPCTTPGPRPPCCPTCSPPTGSSTRPISTASTPGSTGGRCTARSRPADAPPSASCGEPRRRHSVAASARVS